MKKIIEVSSEAKLFQGSRYLIVLKNLNSKEKQILHKYFDS